MPETSVQIHDKTNPFVEVGQEVFDRRTHKKIVSTPDRQILLREMEGKIVQANFNKSMALYAIRENSLYTERGYDHFNEYVEATYDFGLRQAYRYAQIGEKILLMLQAAESSEDVDSEEVSRMLTGMSTRQWREIGHLSDEDLKKLGAGEDYIAPDGVAYSLNQLTEMVAKDLKARLSDTRRDKNTLEEKLLKVEAELKSYEDAQSGDAKVAGELALQTRRLKDRIAALEGEQKRGQDATDDLLEASGYMDQAISLIRPLIPRDAEEFVSMIGEASQAAGVLTKYKGLIDGLYNRYVLMEAQARGE